MLKPRPSIEEVHAALQRITENSKEKALNYAVGYARCGLGMDNPHELRTQCLYVLNNMTHWRGETAKAVRTTLKQFCSLA